MTRDRALRWTGAGVAALCILGAILWASERLAIARAVANERTRLAAVATLAASNYRRQIDMFELVATTLSDDPEVRAALDARDRTATRALNDRLALLSARLDASVIYLMNGGGTTVVSSNWRQPDSFLGENYRFRAYFAQAMARGEHSQFALGTRSRVPGLFIARRIAGRNGPAGVLVVKVRFDRLEREWARSIGTAFVADRQGVILVTSRPAQRFETTVALSPAARAQARDGQEFGDAPLRQAALYANGAVLGEGGWSGQSMLGVTVPVADARTLSVMSPIAAAVRSAQTVARLGVALVALVGLATYLLVAARRRQRTARAERVQQARLDDLRTRLEQANRLSFLGQIAAGVGHELNQPLTAIGIRADNATRLIAQDRGAEAGQALREIGALVGRAGAITGELRRFARRADGSLGSVPLSAALDGLALLLGDRLRQTDAVLSVALPDEMLAVVADQGRLEQVLVNLVQNALDAGGTGTRIAITARAAGERVIIEVADNGPGLAPAQQAVLFQPFTSSKVDGLGLGLVISRDIVHTFGGTIDPIESATGATFRIVLPRAGAAA